MVGGSRIVGSGAAEALAGPAEGFGGASAAPGDTETGAAETVAMVVFHTAERRFGLPAADVERAFAAIEITPLAGAPAVIAGVVNIHGSVVPVLDLRRRLGHEPTVPSLSAKLVVTGGTARPIALLADHLDGVWEIPRRAIAACAALVPGARLIKGVAAVPEGLIFIQDVEAFLSADEEASLDAALRRAER